jgi:hypothetical protein
MFDDDARDLIPGALMNRLEFRYLQVRQLRDENPIKKLEVFVYSVGREDVN